MNLWSDLDNDHQLPQNTAGRGRMRRPTEHVVLSSLRDWLLKDYVAAYCRSLGATRIFRRCYWIDALGIDARVTTANPVIEVPSAPSLLETSETRPKKGRKKESAVVPPALLPIISLSQALTQEAKSITLYGLVLEAGSSKRKEGRAVQNGATHVTKEVTVPKESGIVRASWLEAAPAVLREIDQSPAIFLLNPFGQTMFSYDDLASLYQRTVPTELCLLISHKQAGMQVLTALRTPSTSSTSSTPSHAQRAATLTAVLRSDRWKTLSTNEEEMEQTVDKLIDLLVASMQRHFLLPVQRIALSVQIRPAVIESVPYTLIFATRRQDSLFSMNDAVCLYHRRIYEQSHRGVLGEEWFAAQQRERFEEELQQLHQRVLQQGRAQRVRRWPELRQQVLLANFGQFTLRNYDEIVSKLLLSREVRCEWRQKPAENEEDRIPGNDDTLIWSS